jgi:hypothetical protein
VTKVPAPMCTSCLWLHPTENMCQAFPDGVPIAILESRVDHRRPVEGDHGIQFEQDPDLPRLDHEAIDSRFPR